MPTTDPVIELSRSMLTDFARRYHQDLGVDDQFEDDEQRLFSLLVQVAELYVDHLTDAGALGFRSAIDCTADALVENLDVLFAEALAR